MAIKTDPHEKGYPPGTPSHTVVICDGCGREGPVSPNFYDAQPPDEARYEARRAGWDCANEWRDNWVCPQCGSKP